MRLVLPQGRRVKDHPSAYWPSAVYKAWQQATLEDIRARMKTIRALREEFRGFLRQLSRDAGYWRC